MSKFIQKFFAVLILAGSFAFASCSDDDDVPAMENGKVEINGKQYPLSAITREGSWSDYDKIGSFTLAVINGNDVDYYEFEFESNEEPKAGDDFANMNLTLMPLVAAPDVDIEEYSYSGGSAKITSTNESEDEMTVKFSSLKMNCGGNTFTFNGTTTLMFDF